MCKPRGTLWEIWQSNQSWFPPVWFWSPAWLVVCSLSTSVSRQPTLLYPASPPFSHLTHPVPPYPSTPAPLLFQLHHSQPIHPVAPNPSTHLFSSQATSCSHSTHHTDPKSPTLLLCHPSTVRFSYSSTGCVWKEKNETETEIQRALFC